MICRSLWIHNDDSWRCQFQIQEYMNYAFTDITGTYIGKVLWLKYMLLVHEWLKRYRALNLVYNMQHV